MRTAWMVCVALVPALAWADDSRPYVTHNGRGVEAPAPASVPSPAPAAAATAFGSNASRPAVVSAAVAAANSATAAAGAAVPASSGQAVTGRSTRPLRGIQKRRGVAAPGGTGSTTQAPPPEYSKPGALIRTAGQLPVYSDPGNARTASVEGGGLITIDQSKAHDAARSNGVTYGAPDTRPGANPTSGAGGSAVTSNGGSAATTNGGGSGGASGGGGATTGGGDGGRKSKDESAPAGGTGFDGSF